MFKTLGIVSLLSAADLGQSTNPAPSAWIPFPVEQKRHDLASFHRDA